jgi:hypothetical protein
MPKILKLFGIKSTSYVILRKKYNVQCLQANTGNVQLTQKTATHVIVTGLTTMTRNLGHKLYMDNSVSSPDLFDDLHTVAINCCGIVRPN